MYYSHHFYSQNLHNPQLGAYSLQPANQYNQMSLNIASRTNMQHRPINQGTYGSPQPGQPLAQRILSHLMQPEMQTRQINLQQQQTI